MVYYFHALESNKWKNYAHIQLNERNAHTHTLVYDSKTSKLAIGASNALVCRRQGRKSHKYYVFLFQYVHTENVHELPIHICILINTNTNAHSLTCININISSSSSQPFDSSIYRRNTIRRLFIKMSEWTSTFLLYDSDAYNAVGYVLWCFFTLRSVSLSSLHDVSVRFFLVLFWFS